MDIFSQNTHKLWGIQDLLISAELAVSSVWSTLLKKKPILRAFETTKLNNYTESADCTYVICKNSIESVILSLYMAYTQFTAVHRITKHNGKKRNMHTVIKVRFVE